MAVTTIHSSDKEGVQLDAAISAAQTVVNGLSSTGASHFLYAQAFKKLTDLQTQAVYYYLAIGRITPATVLSTLS